MESKASNAPCNHTCWWAEEFDLDERRAFKKAFLTCKAEGRIKTGPNTKVGIQLQTILQWLRDSDDYWKHRLSMKRPPGSLKWEGIYRKAWDLIREKEPGDGKKTPARLTHSEQTPSFYHTS